ncbi:hypothetical protein [Pseudomonas sp. FME51]|nr:hypothetical protein [Pseudomonas sp. FME51]
MDEDISPLSLHYQERVVSGDRSLNKNPIAALSRCFQIDPGPFL